MREGGAAEAAPLFLWGFCTDGEKERRIADWGFRTSGRCAADAAHFLIGTLHRRGRKAHILPYRVTPKQAMRMGKAPSLPEVRGGGRAAAGGDVLSYKSNVSLKVNVSPGISGTAGEGAMQNVFKDFQDENVQRPRAGEGGYLW